MLVAFGGTGIRCGGTIWAKRGQFRLAELPVHPTLFAFLRVAAQETVVPDDAEWHVPGPLHPQDARMAWRCCGTAECQHE